MINKLVDTGKISEEEGKSLINDFERKRQLQQQELENEFLLNRGKIIKTMDIPTREDFNNLEARIEILERSMPGAIRFA